MDLRRIDPKWWWFWEAVAIYPFMEGDGTTVRNVKGDGIGALTGNGSTPLWEPASVGLGLMADYSDVQSRVAVTDPALDDTFAPSGLSLVCYGDFWTSAANDARIIERSHGTGAEGDHDWMLSESNGSLRMRLRTGITTTTLVGSYTFLDDDRGIWAGTYDGTTMRLWTQDRWDSNTQAKSGAVAPRSNSSVAFLNRADEPSQPWCKPVFWIAVFGRALSEGELRQLTADPFGPFTPVRYAKIARRIATEEAGEYDFILEGWRWRTDTVSESGEGWTVAQDADDTCEVGQKRRLRLIVQAPESGQYQLEAAPDGTENWFKVIP